MVSKASSGCWTHGNRRLYVYANVHQDRLVTAMHFTVWNNQQGSQQVLFLLNSKAFFVENERKEDNELGAAPKNKPLLNSKCR